MTNTTKPDSRIIMPFFFTKYTRENAQYANCHFDYHDVMVTTFCKSSLNQFKSD